MNPTPSKTKVVYIASQERSGSTLISQILGQIEGFFSVGELYIIWRYGLMENRLCGCGERMHDCQFWNTILEKAQLQQSDGASLFAYSRQLVRQFPGLLLPGSPKNGLSKLGNYPEKVATLYQAVQQQTQSRVLVDASKSIVHYYLLSQLDQIDLYMVHLVRDPHGVEYSLQKHKKRGRPECMDHTLVKASLGWVGRNILMEHLGQQHPERYVRINYEQFIHHPQETLRSICDMLQEEVTSLPIDSNVTFQVTQNHVIAGSAQRFRAGSDQLKLDETWKVKLKRREQVAVTALTLPLLARYGYINQREQYIDERVMSTPIES